MACFEIFVIIVVFVLFILNAIKLYRKKKNSPLGYTDPRNTLYTDSFWYDDPRRKEVIRNFQNTWSI